MRGYKTLRIFFIAVSIASFQTKSFAELVTSSPQAGKTTPGQKNQVKTPSSVQAKKTTPLVKPTPFPSPPPPTKAPHSTGRFEARFRILIYQDSVKITDSTNGDFSITSNNTAACPGGAYVQTLYPSYQFTVEGCVMIGSADARGSGSSSTANQNFSVTRASLFGFELRPGIEREIAARKLKIGLAIPILIKSSTWGEVDGGASAKSSLISVGGVLTFQAIRDRFGFIGDFGFIKKITTAAYSFGVSYQL